MICNGIGIEIKELIMKFSRLNVMDYYNINMENVDVSDQLQNVYGYDTQWYQDRKWWWYVLWCKFQGLLTNCYFFFLYITKTLISVRFIL